MDARHSESRSGGTHPQAQAAARPRGGSWSERIAYGIAGLMVLALACHAVLNGGANF